MYKIQYSFEDFNKYNVLKVPFTLKLTTVYLLKHFFLAFIPMLALLPKMRMKDMADMLIEFAHTVTTTELLISCIPAMFVFGAMGRRLPFVEEGSWYRKIWKNGRILLLLSVGLELLFFSVYLFLGIKPINEYTLGLLYLDVMIVLYLLRAQRVKDVFAEFPDYDERAARARKNNR
ncbi:DUF2919 family protein [Candidatus Albibeggiatoa sp. nov. NOAA]|uniref:DUF2919 family protein n=1 Tax=Candidatus Albibeggiatoa sp. nov. NOAA TaxID=3162724 RepID=UPI003303215E|nr:DUF2919 domain-containing protein [Thiotrichaceae bacterium]